MKKRISKRGNSRQYFGDFGLVPKSKRSQETLGIGFGVIFSIILIVFFIVIAGIVIKSFLDIKKCAELGIFVDRFGSEVKKTWKPKYRTESIVPIASYTIKTKDALGKQLGPVPTEADLENFRANIKERGDELTLAKITYLCSEGQNIGKWVEEDLLENKVKLLKQ